MASRLFSVRALTCIFLLALASSLFSQAPSQNDKTQNPSPPKAAAPKQAASAKHPSADEELQQAINNSGSDRAALVRNLETFLKEYPESQQRPQIYRALVKPLCSCATRRAPPVSPNEAATKPLSAVPPTMPRASSTSSIAVLLGRNRQRFLRKIGRRKRSAIARPCWRCVEGSSSN